VGAAQGVVTLTLCVFEGHGKLSIHHLDGGDRALSIVDLDESRVGDDLLLPKLFLEQYSARKSSIESGGGFGKSFFGAVVGRLLLLSWLLCLFLELSDVQFGVIKLLVKRVVFAREISILQCKRQQDVQ